MAKTKTKKVYLLEIDRLKMERPIDRGEGLKLEEEWVEMGRLEPVGIFNSDEEACKAFEALGLPEASGLITEIPIGELFPKGIGEARHIHKDSFKGKE